MLAQACPDGTGAHTIHRDPTGAIHDGHLAGQTDDPVLGGNVRGAPAGPIESRHRRPC